MSGHRPAARHAEMVCSKLGMLSKTVVFVSRHNLEVQRTFILRYS